MPIALSHPYWFIAELIQKHSEVDKLEFSYYTYVPQSVADERTLVLIERDEFLDPNHMAPLILKAFPGKELAIHSKVRLRSGGSLHIPMVDMSTSAKAHLIKLQSLLSEGAFDGFQWFASGRSFHGYGRHLITAEEWRKLMGILLLSNQRGMMPTVDPRWIGHRLLAGYSALRWSRNTAHYIESPALIRP